MNIEQTKVKTNIGEKISKKHWPEIILCFGQQNLSKPLKNAFIKTCKNFLAKIETTEIYIYIKFEQRINSNDRSLGLGLALTMAAIAII